MIKVLLTSGLSGDRTIARQFPMGKTQWGDIQFFFGDESEEQYDWWVVCHSSSISAQTAAICDPEHIVFISMEPPTWGRPEAFFRQFSHLVSCDSGIDHPNLIKKNGISWWVGVKVRFENGHHISREFVHDYDSFSSMPVPEKKDRISIITSGKKRFPGHHKRLRFIEKLKKHPISQHIDFFGGYTNPIEDKLDGLLGYKYHVALENSSIDDYWTEKFADPLLAYSMPIYYGCTNIDAYFPEGGYIAIDIDDFDRTVSIIEHALDKDIFSKKFDTLLSARSKILNEYNILRLVADICREPAGRFDEVTIYPQSSFLLPKKPFFFRVLRKARRYLRNYL